MEFRGKKKKKGSIISDPSLFIYLELDASIGMPLLSPPPFINISQIAIKIRDPMSHSASKALLSFSLSLCLLKCHEKFRC